MSKERGNLGMNSLVSGKIRDQRGLISDQRGLFKGSKGPLQRNRGPLQPNQGPMGPGVNGARYQRCKVPGTKGMIPMF